jgi:hypothetical protein
MPWIDPGCGAEIAYLGILKDTVAARPDASTNTVAAQETPWAANGFISARRPRTHSAELRRETTRATFCGRMDDQLIKLQDRTETHAAQ